MIKFPVLLAFIACQSIFLVAEATKCLQPTDIYILAGQSNMAGRGGISHGVWDRVIPPECQPNPSILRLSASLAWEEAKAPLHKDIDSTKTCGIGPGMSFANSLLQKDPNSGCIGLVPCAIGGTNINQWKRGSNLFNQLINRVNAAKKSGGQIKAMLWYQGESDTSDLQDAMAYGKNIETFFIDVRADLHMPTLPIIEVPLSSGEGNYMDIVKKAQLALRLPNLWSVDAKGFKMNPDKIHLDTPSQVRLGEMLSDAVIQHVSHH